MLKFTWIKRHVHDQNISDVVRWQSRTGIKQFCQLAFKGLAMRDHLLLHCLNVKKAGKELRLLFNGLGNRYACKVRFKIEACDLGPLGEMPCHSVASNLFVWTFSLLRLAEDTLTICTFHILGICHSKSICARVWMCEWVIVVKRKPHRIQPILSHHRNRKATWQWLHQAYWSTQKRKRGDEKDDKGQKIKCWITFLFAIFKIGKNALLWLY